MRMQSQVCAFEFPLSQKSPNAGGGGYTSGINDKLQLNALVETSNSTWYA